jgi:hydroxyacylglutathione hydrolase
MFLSRLRAINLEKPSSQPAESAFAAVGQEELLAASDTAIIDIRGWLNFGEGHFPGSLNVDLESVDFVASVGIFVERTCRILLVAEDCRQACRAQLELLRAGFQSVAGFIEAQNLPILHRITQLAVADLKSTLSRGGKPELLDVRSARGWRSTSIPGSTNIPLEMLPLRFWELSRSKPLVVLCEDGYRSAVASSWLQSKGFESVHYLVGGMCAYGMASMDDMGDILPALSFSTV